MPISLEVIPQLDADHIFITTDTGQRTKRRNCWPTRGHVYQIADSKKIDDVLAALVK
ncbi:hypothetical protein [Paenibacillus marchantiophytorum]|uniref:hypothetical protein n=1 Tax=Paenibacillus marchantiophytorum TaxID=1619310 RepID=UPI001664FD3C|nr:hypothetical protein [Paenibacillus marchantiophytorum]